MHAVILAGGKGTRLRPLTDARPKPLVSFMGEPFAVGLLRRLAAVGCVRATFLVGRDRAPWALLERAGPDAGVEVAVETEPEPLDTAGAARRLFARGTDGPTLVCNGDILTDLDYAALLRAHGDAGAAATLALTRVPDTSSFGVVVCDGEGRVRRFVEKPPPGTVDADTVNAGTYVLAPDAFDGFPGDGPLSFERVVFPGLLDAGATVLGVPTAAYWQDLGTPQRYLAGHRDVLAGRCDWPGAPGLRRAAPLAAIHDSAEVASDAVLREGVVVGAGCVVETSAELADTVLCDGAHVGAGARLHRVILGEGAHVAAHAAVTDAVLADGAGRRS